MPKGTNPSTALPDSERLSQRIERLNDIGIALSAEANIPKLLEMIIQGAQHITGAEGGTLYLLSEDKRYLRFEIVRNQKLDVCFGGTSCQPPEFPPVPLFDEDGVPNNRNVVTYAVNHDKNINIHDAYAQEGFDFSGTKAFDAKTGYRSQSMLTVPLKNHEQDIIGVMQLINATDSKTGAVKVFSVRDQQLVGSLASQAAVALTNKYLIGELEELLDSFIRLVAEAIDEKSPYTGGHCRRVPELTLMLAKACCDETIGPLADFHMSAGDHRELSVAGWLHDCGKITTPEYVVDKATKLETIFDRIHLVGCRFELLKRDAEIEKLKALLANQESAQAKDAIERRYQEKIAQYDLDRAFLRVANVGGEYMDIQKQDRVKQIAQYRYRNEEGVGVSFLSENEVHNLLIERGTLTGDERKVINHHIVATINMLERLPFPKHLRRVREYAGGHHERMDGKGYPGGLTREQMSWQARMMAIADIFEALTASDRPYKSAKTLTESLFILGKMKLDHHVDPDLFDVFVRQKVYLEYARLFLTPEQIDEVDESKIPGYTP